MTVDLVPSTDLVPSLPSRIVTVNVTDAQEGAWAADQSVRFRLVGDVHVSADRRIVLGHKGVTLPLPEGRGQVRLPVWSASTGEWAVEVKPSWTPHPYYIRVPAGSGSVDLSQINPLSPVDQAVAQWLLTNASATINEGAAWNVDVSVAGGSALFDFTVPPGGEAVKRPLLTDADQAGLSFGFYDTNAFTTGTPRAVNGSLVHIPFGSLATQLWIRWGATVEVLTRWLNASSQGPWRRLDNNPTELAADDDLGSLAAGDYLVSTPVAVAQGLPGDIGGLLQHVGNPGTAQYQIYVPAGAEPRLYIQKYGASGQPTGWARADAGAVEFPPPITSRPPSSGWRTVPLAVTMPGGSATQSAATGSVRWVRRWAHMPGRVRLHISNRHPSTPGSTGPSLDLIGVKLGVGSPDGGMTSAVDAFGAATVPADGSELVSPWVDCPATDGEHLAITLAWTGGATQHIMQGGGWVQDVTTGWDAATVSGWMRSPTTPLFVWVEAEVPARVPVLAVNGDSISIGTATGDPVGAGWPAEYARAEGALPVLYSQHGSSMQQWAEADPRWDLLYPGMPLDADALIMALGQNDLQPDVTVQTLQGRYGLLRDAHDARFPGVPVYIAGVTPSNKPSDVQAVRRDFNAWLRGLPRGERRFYDFASVIGDPADENLAPEYSADGVHPNSAGQAALGALVAEHPVTPYTLTLAALRAI